MSKKLTKEEFLEKLKTDRDFNNRYGRKHITEGKMVLPPCHYGFQVYTRELSQTELNILYNKRRGVGEVDTKYTIGTIIAKDPNIPTRAISLMWNQRSVDTFLGLPFNIASYGLLLEIIAKEVNMVPDELIGNLGDVHLYSNHIEQAKEQIGKEMTTEERMDWWFKNNKPNRDVCDYVDSLDDLKKDEHFDKCNVPKQTREPFPLPKLGEIPNWECYEIADIKIENYQSHPAIKAPLSN